ncbi:MAG: PEGA domain-containing protein [Deltaproteobacteria bacterium]|nr:PEGA domain-containing protein [Deltaproteobacteria bacterium]
MEFRDEAHLPPFERALLADSARGAALKTPFLVMTRENMLALLPPSTRLEDCVDECEVDVGRALGAHFVVTGVVGRVEGRLQLLLRLYETQGGALKGQARAVGAQVSALQVQAARAAEELFAALAPGGEGEARARTLLWVLVEPADARDVEVRLDGFVLPLERARRVGGGYAWPARPGAREVEVRARGFSPERRRVEVTEGAPAEARVRLYRRRAAAPCASRGGGCEAELWVYTQPPGALVLLDGRSTGQRTRPSAHDPRVGSVALRLPAGDHVVSARLAGHEEAERLVRLKPGDMDITSRERPLRLRPSAARLELTTRPAGALVRLNGEVVGKTPLRLDQVTPGLYWLEVVAEGVAAREELVALTPRAPWRGDWALAPTASSLALSVRYEGAPVEGAALWVGGLQRGVTDARGEARLAGLAAGAVTVEVRHPLYTPLSSRLTLPPGEARRALKLTGAFAELEVRCAECAAGAGEARVFFGGEEVPLGAAARVPAGAHWLQVRPRDEDLWQPHRARLTLGVGERRAVEVRLAPHAARLTLTSDPPGARALLDGEEVGVTPVELSTASGLRRVRLEFPLDADVPYDELTRVPKGGRALHVNTRRRTLISATCDPPGGLISLNGLPHGPAPRHLDVAPGEHALGCALFGVEGGLRLQIAEGERLARAITLSSERLDAARWRARWGRRAGQGMAAVGAAAALAGLAVWALPMREAMGARDDAARAWLAAPDEGRRAALYARALDEDAAARAALSLGGWLLGGGAALSAVGGGVWWWGARAPTR